MSCYLCGSETIARRMETPLVVEACAEHARNLEGFWLQPKMKVTPASFHKAREYEGGPRRDGGDRGGMTFRKAAGK